MEKKGISGQMLGVIITAAILLITAFVLLGGFQFLFGKQVAFVGKELSLTADYDGDLVVDKFDKCICVPGDVANQGCPIGEKPPTIKVKVFCGCENSQAGINFAANNTVKKTQLEDECTSAINSP